MVERWTSRGDQKAAEVGGWVQRFGRCRYSDLIGVVMAALGVAAFYQLAHVDPIWRVASMMVLVSWRLSGPSSSFLSRLA